MKNHLKATAVVALALTFCLATAKPARADGGATAIAIVTALTALLTVVLKDENGQPALCYFFQCRKGNITVTPGHGGGTQKAYLARTTKFAGKARVRKHAAWSLPSDHRL